MRRKIEVITNALVIAVALVFILAPNGPVLGTLTSWRESANERRLVTKMWSELTDGAHVVGPTEQPVVAIEFLDYQCRFCKSMHDRFDEWGTDEEFAIAIRHLPLTGIHANADLAARISICGERVPDQWKMIHSLLYEVADSLHKVDWVSTFEDSGIGDAATIATCVETDSTTKRLEADMELAALLNLRSTPTYIFADGITRGIITEESLRLRGVSR